MYTSPSGKSYIGQTWNEQKRRWDHRQTNARKSVFHDAIKKYGKNSFKYEILHSNIETQDELNRLEILEIKERNTIVPNGYNLKIGGDQCGHNEKSILKMKMLWENDEFRKRLINSFKEAAKRPDVLKRLTDNGIKNSRNANINAKKSMSLKKAFSDEKVREKRSLQRKEEWENPDIRKKRTESVKKALNKDSFKEYASKKMKELWKNESYRNSMILKNKGRKRSEEAKRATGEKLSKPILCIDTGVIYKSVSEAALSIGISHSCICCAANGKQLTAGGYKWKYVGKN